MALETQRCPLPPPAAMGIATTAIYGVWFFHEQDHIHDSVLHDSISAERGGASLCLFIVGPCHRDPGGGRAPLTFSAVPPDLTSPPPTRLSPFPQRFAWHLPRAATSCL